MCSLSQRWQLAVGKRAAWLVHVGRSCPPLLVCCLSGMLSCQCSAYLGSLCHPYWHACTPPQQHHMVITP
jgi:hypothetical protein